MIGTWMVYAMVVAAVLSAGALVAERALQLLGLPRRGVWASSIAASMLLPIALPVWWATSRGASVTAAPPPEPFGGSEPIMLSAEPLVLEFAGGWEALVERGLAFGWLAASSISLLILLFSTVSLYRMRREWREVRVAGSLVLVSRRTGPALMGFFRPAIVLPEWVLQWEAQRQRMIVEHEREHARARDPLVMMLAWCALVLTPWNLPLWWQAHRLRLAVEMDCDRRVLRSVRDVHGYGVLLLEVSRHGGDRWLPLAAFAEPASFLERRIRAMTARRPRHWIVQIGVSAALLCALPVVLLALQPADGPIASRVAGWLEHDAELASAADPEPELVVYVERETETPSTGPEPQPSNTPAVTAQDTSRIFEVAELSRPPRLNNASTVASVMERLYPRMLQDAGIGGTVIAQYVIERDGTVNPATIRIVETPHEQLGMATRAALDRFRFTPGQLNGVNVRVVTQMPITWQPSRPASPPVDVPVQPGSGQVEVPEVPAAPRDFTGIPPTPQAPAGQPGATPAPRPAPNFAYEVAVLSRPPRLNNAAEVAALMQQLYPTELDQAGGPWTVIVQFVIQANGEPDPTSFQIVSSPNQTLSALTLAALRAFRFTPGQYNNQNVRVLTQMPITWQPQR